MTAEGDQGSNDGCAVFRAGECSLVELAEQHAAGFAGYAVPVHSDAEALAERIRADHIDLWASFGLRQGGVTVALVLVARRGRRTRIASMGVPAPARRHGWGRKALRVAIDEAAARGDSVQLEVLTDNHAAVALYEQLGFRSRRRLVGYEADLDRLRRPGPLESILIAEAAARVAASHEDLTWQLEAASLYGLGGSWEAWTNGPSTAITKRRQDTLVVLSILTAPERRREGHARALVGAIAAHQAEATRAQIISILPAGHADDFLSRSGFRKSPLEQFEMWLDPADG